MKKFLQLSLVFTLVAAGTYCVLGAGIGGPGISASPPVSASNITTGTLAVANGGTGSATLAGAGIVVSGGALGTPSSGVISACTSTSMVLTTPVLGTPTSGALTNCTSIPAAQLTGTATNLTLVTPILGTPQSGNLSNCTNAPAPGSAITTADALADVKWGPSATTQKALMLQGLASQTANVLEVQGSNGTVVFAVDVPSTTFTGTTSQISGAGAAAVATSADNTTAYGNGALSALTTGDGNIAIGPTGTIVTTGSNNIFIGTGSVGESTGTSNTGVIGGATSAITSLFLGKGMTSAAPSTFQLRATNASGAADAAAFIINGGLAGGASNLHGAVAIQIGQVSSTSAYASVVDCRSTYSSFSSTFAAQIVTTQAGVDCYLTSTNAVAGSATAGAAKGGDLYLTTGNAAQKTSGNANGGDLIIATGTSVGTGRIGQLQLPKTITTPGTTGNQTINKLCGTVNIAAAGTTVTVTNSACATTSIVLCTIQTNDATATGIKNVVPGAGSFVITLNAGATAEIAIGFMVIN